MERKRYCKIEFCANYHGTTDKQVHFFLLPIAGNYRAKWIEMISRHQHFNATDDPKYLICDRHFHKQNIKRKDGRIALKNGTVPAIFPRRIVHIKDPPSPPDPLENIADNIEPPIEDALNDESCALITIDPLKREEGVEVVIDTREQYNQSIVIIEDPPEQKVDRVEPTENSTEVVNWLLQNASNDNNVDATIMDKSNHEQSNGDEEISEKSLTNDCKRCHELAIELALTTIQINAAGLKVAQKEKIIRQQAKNLRHSNIELQYNNDRANNLYANDSNEDDEEQSKETKKEKTYKKYPRKGRHLPYGERQKFRDEMLSALNQMSDSCALQAMMDIQMFINKCRRLSETIE